ncbi:MULTISPECIES: tyrosine--tRNA ligase [unclassified Paenibacillus]|uniref:tyrosine--tRNA ligase n=1 Tax=unclassified Paenibacillus TaxID=185978 RepID=UPI0009572F5C|nr:MULTISPECIES: tyrosine--tRNA ligase [unclassified Paenibacillus]ASS68433.1 tyrosine--tRNA ligase [Paenibacillus sp. RUD330]SIR33285.1 tyrosyl-tRNA synthetase [Paenibacillus sp. RU4X]SIR44305.1 tyrosyl-tRNA synthetase [Paenibacillus sp. RU4T]
MAQEQAAAVNPELLEELEYRGLVYQVTNREELSKKMSEGRVTLYCGFDPTADSLHIGSLLPILMLRRFQLAGHNSIALVGGGTGLIGDPSGRSTERSLNTDDTVANWTESLKNQLSRFLDFEAAGNPAKLVSNYDWLAPLDIITFLRDIGKNFTVNYMLAKDSVDSRLANGISFTEFSYMILQAYDFFKLNRDHGVNLQLGGSDQWGNITAGLDLIGKMGGGDAYGITMPLVTKSDGKKFGKSESGAVWLDRNKTSAYQFYQFWINTDDSDVIRFLKYFTFLSREEIAALEQAVASQPEKREAQRELARQVTRLVHGADAVESAEKITAALFSGDVTQLSEDELVEALQDMPTTVMGEAAETGLIDLLVEAKAAPSRRQAKQDIESGAVYVNGVKQTGIDTMLTSDQRLHGRYVVLRRGKKNYYLVKFE